MKKIKVILAIIAIVAIVAGTFAFKAKQGYTFNIFTTTTTTYVGHTCWLNPVFQTLSTYSNLGRTFYSTVQGGKCVTSTYDTTLD